MTSLDSTLHNCDVPPVGSPSHPGPTGFPSGSVPGKPRYAAAQKYAEEFSSGMVMACAQAWSLTRLQQVQKPAINGACLVLGVRFATAWHTCMQASGFSRDAGGRAARRSCAQTGTSPPPARSGLSMHATALPRARCNLMASAAGRPRVSCSSALTILFLFRWRHRQVCSNYLASYLVAGHESNVFSACCGCPTVGVHAYCILQVRTYIPGNKCKPRCSSDLLRVPRGESAGSTLVKGVAPVSIAKHDTASK